MAIHRDDFNHLERAYKAKKAELKQRDQQSGFHGFKGKNSLNPKHSQLETAKAGLVKALSSKRPEKVQDRSISGKKKARLCQLSFKFCDTQSHNRKTRKSIERNLKKDKAIFWIPFPELRIVIENLRDGKTSLRKRSQKAYDWFNSLKPNKFKPGCVAIQRAEWTALSSGFNRHQLTELFIAYLTACLHSQSKSKFIFKDKKNFISHFGFNNSYNAMSWSSKQFAFMERIINRLKALKSIKLFEIKAQSHESGKVFYKLVFKSLNIFSKALTPDQKKKALKLVKKFYIHKGLDPPPPVFLLGLDFKA